MKYFFILTALLAMSTGVSHAESSAVEAPLPDFVTRVRVGDKEILGNEYGMTAYVFDVDTDSTSKCYDGCAKAWPAILLEADDHATAPFGETIRKDGTRQLTYMNHPLYLYFRDVKSGDILGDGIGSVWHIVNF